MSEERGDQRREEWAESEENIMSVSFDVPVFDAVPRQEGKDPTIMALGKLERGGCRHSDAMNLEARRVIRRVGILTS